ELIGGAAFGFWFAIRIEVVSRRVGPYRRIRARIVDSIPHLPRRSRGTLVRRAFDFVITSSMARTRAGDRLSDIATKSIFPVTSRTARIPPSDSTVTWVGAFAFMVE